MVSFSQLGMSGDGPSYTYGQDGRSLKDHVRGLLGDKGQLLDVQGNPVWLLSDQEIERQLAGYSYANALALCCDMCVTAVGREPDTYKAGASDAEASWAERIEAWRSLAFKARHGYIETPQFLEESTQNAVSWSGVPSFGQLCEGQPGSLVEMPNSGRHVCEEQRRR